MRDVPVLDVQAKAWIKASGNDPRRYVPDSLEVHGDLMTWAEKCRARCTHDPAPGENEPYCSQGRSSLLPTTDDP